MQEEQVAIDVMPQNQRIVEVGEEEEIIYKIREEQKLIIPQLLMNLMQLI